MSEHKFELTENTLLPTEKTNHEKCNAESKETAEFWSKKETELWLEIFKFPSVRHIYWILIIKDMKPLIPALRW